MKPSSVRKVFGIPSYFPDNDSEYHIEMRRERTRRFRELLAKLEEYWPDIDIIVIAQNWQDFELPEVKNRIRTFHYGKLGILGARKELRNKFLASDYDYMIMLDDDAMITVNEPKLYMDEIDKHPDGFGAIRRAPQPSVLQFFAISKHIFSQVEFADVDPEKGQGFEDDVFSATCWGKFPNEGFMFPEGWVNESSLHYFGPGKCPSTWSQERKYDWDHMRSFTKTQVRMLSNGASATDSEKSNIDVVIPYVNGADTKWAAEYIKYTHSHNVNSVRFRSWGILKYLLRAIEQYMPFVNNVYLLLSGESQVPAWLNTKNVKIIYHRDFIPDKFLPTFNSCTIESYLWNIPGLSDRIIYFNDDMFPINPVYVGDFFDDNKPLLRFGNPITYLPTNAFRSQCRAGIDMITKALGKESLKPGYIIKPPHIALPMTKAALTSVGHLCGSDIADTITRCRASKNVNQYIYAYYQYYTDDYVCSSVDFKYFEIHENTIKDIMQTILDGGFQMICINDSGKVKNYARVRYQLQQCFEKKFPQKSRFEL